MVLQFCLAVLAGAVILFVPGLCVLWPLRLSFLATVACSPLITICVLVVSGTLCGSLELLGTIPLITVAALLFVLLTASVLAVSKKAHYERQPKLSLAAWDVATIALYSVVSTAVMYFVFLRPMNGLESFVQFDDNATHLGLISSMIDGGNYSILATTSYPASLPVNQIPFDNASFYPNGWHIVTALSCIVAGTSAPIAENAINVLFTSVVFPVGIAALLSKMFPGRRDVLVAGAFTCLFSAAFPLRMLTVHGPFPNVAAFCLVPSTCALFMRVFDSSEDVSVRPLEIPVFLVACMGLAGTHPNAIFSCIVLLLPYLVLEVVPQLVQANKEQQRTTTRTVRVAQVVTVVTVAIVWVALLQTSLFASVANFIWQFDIDPLSGALNVLDAGYYLGISQPILAALIALGFVICLKHRDTRWPAVSYFLAGLVFLFGLALDYQSRKLVTGYWYNDPERTAALLAIAAIPLSSMGLGTLGGKIGNGLARQIGSPSAAGKLVCACSVVVLALPLSVLNFLEAHPAPVTNEKETAFSFAIGQVIGTYNFDDAQPYSARERSFVQRALELIPDNALVINLPHDGSVFSYPVDRMNVYYKSCRPSGESPESETIRTKLNQIASDEQVQAAVQKTGAQYVLLLGGIDQSAENLYTPLATYNESMWGGLIITDETPGFRCVLADGELRLYEIVG